MKEPPVERLADGSGRDFAEVIRDADSRVDLGRYEVRIDLSRHYDFDTEFEALLTSVLCSELATVEPRNR